MAARRCLSCMNITSSYICEYCGSPADRHNEPHQLPVGSCLRNQYIIGKALGQGGFGITYLGWDQFLDISVAIKEYYPSSMVVRDCSRTNQVHYSTENVSKQYLSGLERFMREAKALAKLRDVPQIVGIHSFFEENGTAYIVMEFIKGTNLGEYMRRKGGVLSADETFRLLRPIMSAMDAVHAAGLVHRDISPDNIMLHPQTGAKLLDFGAVRGVENAQIGGSLARSTEAILKHGFAPIEQYQSRGNLGPWSDIYALCATIFYCLTGTVPEDAPARMTEDLPIPWDQVPGLTPKQRSALNKGMSLRAKDRFSSMAELQDALFASDGPSPQQQTYQNTIFMNKENIWSPAPQSKTSSLNVTWRNTPTSRMKSVTNLSNVSWKNNILASDPYALMNIRCEDVRMVFFLDTLLAAPAWAKDVSLYGDHSVLAWFTNEGYLFFTGNQGINGVNASQGLFQYCSDLTCVDFGGSFFTDAATDLSYMFNGCSSLTEIRGINDLNTARATNLAGMFAGCSQLDELDLENWNTGRVTDMRYMFLGCTGLEFLNLGSWDRRNVIHWTDFLDRDRQIDGKPWEHFFMHPSV